MPLFRTRFRAMACTNEIVVVAGREAEAAEAMKQAATEVLRIERKYSRYRTDEDSIVFRINRAAGSGTPVACDPETLELFTVAARLHQLSGGLFDITSGILRRAWNFNEPVVPTPDQLAPLLARIGFDRIERNSSGVRLPVAGMEIDFGGFGKEYAADRAAAVLRQRGVAQGYVNLGGDIHAIGGGPDGKPWRFGIQDPRDPQTLVGSIDIVDGALATSGDYEKFFEVSGRRFNHILSPLSGYPVDCWRSVSVTGVSTLQAGALTTIAMLKEAGAVSFLDERKCGYLLVDAVGRRIMSQQENRSE
jgi:thiamine biosynthesis lipoprotein